MTAEEYTAALRRIEQGNPKEVLLPLLRKGHSRANEMYMRAALKRALPLPSPKERELRLSSDQLSESFKLSESSTPTRPPDDTLRALWRDRTRLFGEMNKQSNLFHACKTDAERAANSAKVLDWWGGIQAVKDKIDYYEQHGTLPAPTEEGDELPDNPALLAKKLNSLRARISQVKGKPKDLASLDPGTPGLQSKINAAEDDLKRLRILEGKAAVKLKEYESAA